MEHFVAVNAAGEVVGWGKCPDEFAAIQPVPEDCVNALVSAETHDAVSQNPEAWRLFGGSVIERAEMAIEVSTAAIRADGVDECVISGLPAPCMVTVRGAVTAGPVEVAGGALTLTSTAAGAVTVTVRDDPTHKPWRAVVTAG